MSHQKLNWNRIEIYENYKESEEEIIDRLYVINTGIKCSNYIQNPKYGYDFEHAIATKSLFFLPLRSINDINLYTKEYRHLYALKLVIFDEYKPHKICKFLDEGRFRIIPFSNDYYKIFIQGFKTYFISYNSEKISVQTIYKRNVPLDDFYKNNHKDSKTAKSDIYVGTFKLYTQEGYKSNYLISLYKSSCEIDGLFICLNNINLDDFKAKIIYSNFERNFIEKDSILVYEIKSGNKKIELSKQIQTRCHLIYYYLNFIYHKPVYYLGFVNEKLILKDNELSSHNKSFEEKSFNFDRESEDETNYKTENDKKSETSQKASINKININFVNERDPIFDNLRNLPAKIAIFETNDKIFGERLIYDKEDLNLLRYLQTDMINIKNNSGVLEKEVKDIKEQVNKMEVKVSKIDLIEAKMDQIEAKVSKIEQIEEKVSKIEQIEEKVSKMDQIESKMDQIEDDVSKIKIQMSTFDKNMKKFMEHFNISSD